MYYHNTHHRWLAREYTLIKDQTHVTGDNLTQESLNVLMAHKKIDWHIH